MTACELLSTLLLSTSDDKKNTVEWRANAEKKWFFLLPNYANLTDNQKEIAIHFFHVRQKMFEIHLKRHVADLAALRCDFSMHRKKITLAVFKNAPLSFQKIYDETNEDFIISLNRVIENELDENDKAIIDLAQKVAFSSIKKFKETTLIKWFDEKNDEQFTYREILKFELTAPIYDKIEKSDFDVEL